MQAATAATIEYTDYPECERRIYPTENDIAFYKTYEFCEAEGALQVYSKPEGVGHKLSAIRQFAPNTIMPELHSIFTKTSEKSNRLTYYNCTTNLYITNNTAYWAKSLRESGIRTDSRISQLISLGFDIDCHEEGVPLYYSDGICKMLTTAIYNGALPEGFVVNTGRGAAYWIFIDPVNPNNKHALKIYKRLHTKIRTMLKAEIVNWGDNYLYASVDDSVKGINHIMRLPGTFNTKAGRCCHVYHAPAVGYRLNDLYVLADSIDVEWRIVDDTVVSNREIFNTTDEQELAWAKKRFAKRILEWNTERSVVSARSIAKPQSEIAERCITQRWDAVIDFLRRNTTPVGKRHTVLLYCLSTACDYHQAASLEKAQLINSTFAEPLPDKEVAKIVSWVKHPFKDETIASVVVSVPGVNFKEWQWRKLIPVLKHSIEMTSIRDDFTGNIKDKVVTAIVGSPYDLIPYDKELNEATAKRKATRTRKRKDLGEDSETSNSKLEQIEIPDIPDEDPDDEDDD